MVKQIILDYYWVTRENAPSVWVNYAIECSQLIDMKDLSYHPYYFSEDRIKKDYNATIRIINASSIKNKKLIIEFPTEELFAEFLLKYG